MRLSSFRRTHSRLRSRRSRSLRTRRTSWNRTSGAGSARALPIEEMNLLVQASELFRRSELNRIDVRQIHRFSCWPVVQTWVINSTRMVESVGRSRQASTAVLSMKHF